MKNVLLTAFLFCSIGFAQDSPIPVQGSGHITAPGGGDNDGPYNMPSVLSVTTTPLGTLTVTDWGTTLDTSTAGDTESFVTRWNDSAGREHEVITTQRENEDLAELVKRHYRRVVALESMFHRR